MSNARRRNRTFTIEEANKMLPLVRAIAGDYVKLSRDVVERSGRLSEIADRRDCGAPDVYSDELEVAVRKLKKDSLRLDELVAEFRQLGVQLFGHDGIVEFPAKIEGRLVFLSWKFDEPEVLYWRDPDVKSSVRELLAVSMVASTGGCGGSLGL
ncbi:DUF2203 domain-containing protein [Planctomycetota bacterium]